MKNVHPVSGAGISVTRLHDFVDFSKPLATINLPKSLTFLCNFCNGVKIFNITTEIILGNFYAGHTGWDSNPRPNTILSTLIMLKGHGFISQQEKV